MSETNSPELPPKPQRNRTPLIAGLGALAAVAVAATLILPDLLGGGDEAAPAEDAAAERRTVRLGVVDEGKSFWQLLVDRAAEEGIEVQLVNFSDYNTPNPALADGDLDLNKFQHLRYLAQHNVATGDDLVPIGASEIYPIGFYSKRWASVEDVPRGAEVTLSNNPANQVRPLLALEAAGLIELEGDPGWDATLDDVDDESSVIGTITPIDPTQTAASLDSVDVAFVDTTFATAAGLTDEQKIYEEDAGRDDLTQYVNVFAARADDADDPDLLTIVEIYQSEELQEAILAEDGGFEGIFRDDLSVEDQLAELARQEEQLS